MPTTSEPGPPGRLVFEHLVVCGADGVRILGPVDLELVLQGITVVAGPSGSGKTTLLRVCNRLEAPSAGRVLLDGEDLAVLDPLALRRRLGMVFQHPVRFGGTVLDNLRVARSDLDLDGAALALERVGLDGELAHRQADDLSGGEAQRMCLARTLLVEPRVLLVDEPTSSLDRSARLAIEVLVRELAQDGLAVIWVTHDLDQVRRLADRTIVLAAGEVLEPREAELYLTGPDPSSRGVGR